MITIAHRGGAGLWPENTLEAFQHAVDLGVDAIECDAWWSPQRAAVVVTHGQAESPDAPLLAEVLEHFTWRTRVVVDLKATVVVDPVIALLRGHPGWRSRVVCTSFFPQDVQRIQGVFPTMKTGWLWPDATLTTQPLDGVGTVGLHYAHVDPPVVEAWHAANKAVWAWTVNNATHMAMMQEAGVDGLITDYPDQALALAKGVTP